MSHALQGRTLPLHRTTGARHALLLVLRRLQWAARHSCCATSACQGTSEASNGGVFAFANVFGVSAMRKVKNPQEGELWPK